MKTSVFSHFMNEKSMETGNGFTVFSSQSDGRNVSAKVYPVLQGFEVAEIRMETNQYTPVTDKRGNILEINYCHQGRMECQMNDGCLQYAGEGDLCLNMESNHSDRIELPVGYYQGVAVMIDITKANAAVEAWIPELKIDFYSLCERLFKKDDCLLILAQDSIQRIFSSFHTAPDEAKLPYMRIKVMELIIYLHCLDIEKERKRQTFTRLQSDTIKQIHKQITETPGERFTIENLARQYCISPTTLKTGFKAVYGLPIAAYMKEFRIKKGAAMLRESQKSIGEIAKEVGYDSQSKFSAAFKEILKVNPNEYRK